MSVTLYENARLNGAAELIAIAVSDGRFLEFGKAQDLEHEFPDAKREDLGGNVVCPPFADAHIHLDYVYTASLSTHETSSGTLFEAIDNWSDSKAKLSADAIRSRALKAVKMQISHGVQYVRTHVDVTDPKFTALKVMLELKEQLKPYMQIQIVAFPPGGILCLQGRRRAR